MSKGISRRQVLKYGKAGILGLSTFSLVSLGCNSRASGQLKTNVPAEKLISDLQQQIPRLMQREAVPGAAVAVIRDGEILWSRGFGVKNINSGQPVNENTVFAAASLSKPVLAYAAMKLYEQGELDLDAPLTNYTAKPYISDPRIWKISARLVLCHKTGFPNWSGDEPVWIDFPPGSKFSYSSEGFLYLQSVIERITKQPFNDYVTRNVFAPLGMTNSSYIWRSSYQSSTANGHDFDGVPFPVGKPTQANGAGSLRTTATDYAKFLMAMMTPAANDAFRLNENTLNKMLQQNSAISQSLGWGLGWGLERTNAGDFFWHWGDSGIFKSFTLGSKRLKTGIVILTNSENGLRICEDIVRLAIGGQHPAFSFSMIEY